MEALGSTYTNANHRQIHGLNGTAKITVLWVKWCRNGESHVGLAFQQKLNGRIGELIGRDHQASDVGASQIIYQLGHRNSSGGEVDISIK